MRCHIVLGVQASAAADRVRGHSAFLKDEKSEIASERAASGRLRLNSARARRGRLSVLSEARRRERQAEAVEFKEQRRAWEEARRAQRERRGGLLLDAATVARVAERQAASRSLDARLDASERAVDERERAVGVHDANQLRLRLAAVRREKLEWGRRVFVQTVQARSGVEVARQATLAKREEIGYALREESITWRRSRLRQDDAYLRKAKESRERVQGFRQAARESKEESILEKRRSASREARASGLFASRARANQKAVLQGARNAVAAVFKQRFVSREEEEVWSASPLRKLHRCSARFHDRMLGSSASLAPSTPSTRSRLARGGATTGGVRV